jgi:hypothetical protein
MSPIQNDRKIIPTRPENGGLYHRLSQDSFTGAAMLRTLTLREGTRRSRHPYTDAREADVLSVALAALRRPERSAVRDGRPKPTQSAPRFVLVFWFSGTFLITTDVGLTRHRSDRPDIREG